MRFVRDMPGHAPSFPLQAASPVGPPIDPKAKLLDDAYRTSWVSFVPAPSNPSGAAHYAAAPKGAELFGKYDGHETPPRPDGVFGPADPGVALPPDGSIVFPMLPLAGFTAADGTQELTAAELEMLSRQIVGPTRKLQIDAGAPTKKAHALAALLPASQAARTAAAGGLKSTTTPAGFITRYDTAQR